MFTKKKATLDDLLNELTAAKQTLDNETKKLETFEQSFDAAYTQYIRSKRDYENALKAYTQYSGDEYARNEYKTGVSYYEATISYSAATSNYLAAQKRVKKATKIYKKLQRLVAQKADQMGQ